MTVTEPKKKPRARRQSSPPRPARLSTRASTPRAYALLAAALDLFASRNFADVTIKDIGEAVGANAALIYYYFGSKEGLFLATLEAAVDRALSHFQHLREHRTSPPEIIADWLRNHVEVYDVISKLVRIALDYASTARRVPTIDRSINRFYDEERAVVAGAISAGITQGLFKPVDPVQIAWFISTYLDGVMVRSVIEEKVDVERAVAQLQALLWQVLGYREKPARVQRTRAGSRSK